MKSFLYGVLGALIMSLVRATELHLEVTEGV
jgi:hypothetical protein